MIGQIDDPMILPDLCLPSRINRRCQFTGINSYHACRDKQYFLQYPHEVVYHFNSRGFRDREWPFMLQDLQESVWCVGDSFTVGIGQPFDHIWPQVLQRAIGRRVINISMDGASNDWIFRKALQVLDVVNPIKVICMWSYTHRRELANPTLDDESRRLHTSHATPSQDLEHWLQLMNMLQHRYADQVINCTIPEFHPVYQIAEIWQSVKDNSWGSCPKNLHEFYDLDDHIQHELQHVHQCFDLMLDTYKMADAGCAVLQHVAPTQSKVIMTNQPLDWARDHHHFDILTAEWIVDQILNHIDQTNAPKIYLLDSSVAACNLQ